MSLAGSVARSFFFGDSAAVLPVLRWGGEGFCWGARRASVLLLAGLGGEVRLPAAALVAARVPLVARPSPPPPFPRALAGATDSEELPLLLLRMIRFGPINDEMQFY